ncbi:MAG TPA: carboxypeptidase-like regulatory domain-containing protein [Gemmatimonadaceae bacterium]|nr:carboxypeptidase-like regulatory domain-containing protein [Gemmatimonadaceae bacterium]
MRFRLVVSRFLPCYIAGVVLLAAGACHSARPAGAPALADDAHSTFDLTGVVYDETSGRPLAGVLVVLEADPPRQSTTNDRGIYVITDAPRGEYAVSARRIGFFIERREVDATCPITLVDSAGRRIAGGGPCEPKHQRLNFLMRQHSVR